MNRSDARKILGSEDPKKEYRRLSMLHHPDHGGDPEVFNKVRDAYEALTKEELTAEHDLLVQLFLQELDPAKVLVLLGQMEADHYKTIQSLPAKKLRLENAKPIAKGFLFAAVESAIEDLQDEKYAAQTGLAEIAKARTLLNDLYTK